MMCTKQLLERIQKLQEEHGELNICIYADHGQQAEYVYSADIAYVDSDKEVIHEDDMEDYDEDELEKVVMVW